MSWIRNTGFERTNSVSLCSLAGPYDSPILSWFLARKDCLKIPAQTRHQKRCIEVLFLFDFYLSYCQKSHFKTIFVVSGRGNLATDYQLAISCSCRTVGGKMAT